MLSPISNITRQAFHSDKLNILTFPTHARYESGLALTGHNFYGFQSDGANIKPWDSHHAPKPENYILLNRVDSFSDLPQHVDFDLILSQNKFGQFQTAWSLGRLLHVPIVSLEHTLPATWWSKEAVDSKRGMRGVDNVFISEYSIGQWNWDKRDDTCVIKHMVDSDLFRTSDDVRENHLLSVVNDWVNRDWCCGFEIWQRVSSGLPVKVVGDTQELSKPAKNVEELAEFYRSSSVFLNTSTVSPVPTSMLEAMSCGCAVVSTATCMIPEIIEHGVNGFISNDESKLKEYCQLLLNDVDLARKIGNAARETIIKDFNKERFIKEWNTIFNSAKNKAYKGVI